MSRISLLTGFAIATVACCATSRVCLSQAQQKTEAPSASPISSTCRVEPINYKGWQAQQVANASVQLIFVPQNGGRLMQVVFDGHPYLFNNEKYLGKYLPPSNTQWFNYGGDKIWVLPEGNDDEQHWVGNSDVLDDSPFEFRVLSQGAHCAVSLTGPADPLTGLQFTRTVSLDGDSTAIHFHAVIKNASGHPIEWSVQSVSQYDTADANDRAHHNKSIWGFTKTDPQSSYLNKYHVRFGPAENSAAQVRPDGLFAVHYKPLAAELWIDSKDGWLAVIDGATRYGMVERFHYDATKPYPGKASVIFWTNGAELHQHEDGTTTFGDSQDEPPPIYMEAELNSPMVPLEAGESFNFDTAWYPTRADAKFQGVADAGVVLTPLRATRPGPNSNEVTLSGSFGVLYSGKLVARLYDGHGSAIGTRPLDAVEPRNLLNLHATLSDAAKVGRVSLHIFDNNGLDRGSLGEVLVEPPAAGE
jgi:hypothetical protein